MPVFYTRSGRNRFLDSGATFAVKARAPGGRTLILTNNLTDDAVLVASGRPGRGNITLKVYNGLPGVQFNIISSTAAGVSMSWTPAVENLYHVDRSVDSAHGFPDLTFHRLTSAPISTNSFKDLALYPGEQARYRIYRTGSGAALGLHATLNITQVSYGTGDSAMTIDGTGFSSSGVNIIENKVIYTTTGSTAFNFSNCNFEFLIRNCIIIGPGNVAKALSGIPKISFQNVLALGQKPAAAIAGVPPQGAFYKSVGMFFQGSYSRYFSAINCTVRNMGGIRLGNYRGADTNRPIDIHGNLFWNIGQRRVDASGNYILSDWSSLSENGSTGFTNPTKANGYTEPIGREISQILQIDNSGAGADSLSAACVGGMDFYGNLYIGEPLKSSAEDLINFYQAGGESLSKLLKVRANCFFNNPSYDFNATPGGTWNNGMIPNSSGHGPAFQSQTGTLLQDSEPANKKYANYGAYTSSEDNWYIGMGIRVSIQAGHHHNILRATVIGSNLSPDGYSYTNVSGDTRTAPQITQYQFNPTSDTGQPAWGNNTINATTILTSNIFAIGTKIAETQYPWGIKDDYIDLPNSTGNSATKRFATIPEMWQGYYDWHDKAASIGVSRVGVIPA